MAELINLQIEKLPNICVMGKQLQVKMSDVQTANPIPAFWDKCCADGTFAKLEEQKEFIYDPSYVGWMADWNETEGTFTYICGILMKHECPVPNADFVVRQIDACDVAIGWIQGTEIMDIALHAQALTTEGLKSKRYVQDYSHSWWMEFYNCPRFTTPNENGEIILDFYMPCKGLNENALCCLIGMKLAKI